MQKIIKQSLLAIMEVSFSFLCTDVPPCSLLVLHLSFQFQQEDLKRLLKCMQ